MLADNQKKETFLQYMKLLYKKIEPKYRQMRPIVIIDNLAIHKCEIVRKYVEPKFDFWFMPAYSCEFNSIETYWAVAKQAYRK